MRRRKGRFALYGLRMSVPRVGVVGVVRVAVVGVVLWLSLSVAGMGEKVDGWLLEHPKVGAVMDLAQTYAMVWVMLPLC